MPLSWSISTTVKYFTCNLHAAEYWSSSSCLCEFHVSYLTTHTSSLDKTCVWSLDMRSGLILTWDWPYRHCSHSLQCLCSLRGQWTAGCPMSAVSHVNKMNVSLVPFANYQIWWMTKLWKYQLHRECLKLCNIKNIFLKCHCTRQYIQSKQKFRNTKKTFFFMLAR